MIARKGIGGFASAVVALLLFAGSSQAAGILRALFNVWLQPPNQEELLTNKNILIDYVEPHDPDLEDVYNRLQSAGILEWYSQFLAPLDLPRKLRLKTLECGAENAFYSPSDNSITLCYEIVKAVEGVAPTETTPEGISPRDVIVGTVASILLHETGHALFDLYQIPVLGKEEDAADQAAGYILMQFGSDVALHAINGVLWWWGSIANQSTPIFSDFSDVHSTPLQRLRNFLCIAYGHDPETFKHLAVDQDILEKGRAERCAAEFRQVELAFKTTILTHADPTLMQTVLSRKWLNFDQQWAPDQPVPPQSMLA